MKEFKKNIQIIFFGLLLIVGYQTILPLLYFSIFGNLAKSSNFWISNLSYLFFYILFTILLLFIFRNSLKKEWLEFKKNFKSYRKIGISYWLKGIVVMIISNLIIVSITGNVAGNEEQNRDLMVTLPLYAITVMTLFGPFIEEILFRKSFKKAFQNKYFFAIFTAFLFGLPHVMNGIDPFTITNIIKNWQQLLFFIPYGSLGYFFALAYYETDNIFTSTFVHILHNSITVLILVASMMLLG